MAIALSAKQFKAAFRSEKQCRDFLLSLKHPKGFRCKKCKHDEYHDIAHRAAWQCGDCGYQESAKAGTVFHKSKVSLVNWFHAIFEITISKGGISAVELRTRLGLGSYKTAWGMLHKLREAMAKREAISTKIGGVVEVDGTMFGRRITGNQASCYLGVEVTENKKGKPCAGRLRVSEVTKFRSDEAFWFVEENVRDGSVIRSDAGHEFKYVDEHLDVDVQPMRMTDQPEMNSVWLPWVHRIISNIKTSLSGVYHGVSQKYLSSYLAEHCYRFNRRGCFQELQTRLLDACVACGPAPVTYITG